MNRIRSESRSLPVVALGLSLMACRAGTLGPSNASPTDGNPTGDTRAGGDARAGDPYAAGDPTSPPGDHHWLAGDPGPFTPNPSLSGLADDTALDLGQFTCLPVSGEDPALCRRTTDYSGIVYDPHHYKVLGFGGGHSTTMTDAIHELDLGGTLTWTDLYEPTPCADMTIANLDDTNGAWLAGSSGPYPRPVSSHTYDMLAVPPFLDEFVVIGRMFNGGYCNAVGNDIGGKIAHFDRTAGTWSFSPTASGATYDLSVSIPGSEPDPVSGKVVFFGRGGLSLYDPDSRIFDTVTDTLKDASGTQVDLSGVGYANELVYFPPDDRFYLFLRDDGGPVFALALDRTDPTQSTAEAIATSGTPPPGGEHAYDFDAHNGVIGGAVESSVFYSFDPFTGGWSAHTIQGGTPGTAAFHALAYDPVDNVFIFVTDYDSGAHTWAYRLRN